MLERDKSIDYCKLVKGIEIMVESIVQEGRMILELAEDLKQNLSKTKESYHEMEVTGRAFYRLTEDRSNLMSQIPQMNDLIEELERVINHHVQEIESLIE